MKIQFEDSTGCPLPQFVVYPETKEEHMLLKAFFYEMNKEKWKFGLHGYVTQDNSIKSFNFGLIREEK